MSDTEKKRERRTKEERAAAIDGKIEKIRQSISEYEEKKAEAAAGFDAKIAAAQGRIVKLEKAKEELLAPKPKRARKPRKTKKQKIADILKQAQKAGLKPEEIAEKLGVDLSE